MIVDFIRLVHCDEVAMLYVARMRQQAIRPLTEQPCVDRLMSSQDHYCGNLRGTPSEKEAKRYHYLKRTLSTGRCTRSRHQKQLARRRGLLLKLPFDNSYQELSKAKQMQFIVASCHRDTASGNK